VQLGERKKKRGMTLVELLVVISISLVLVSFIIAGARAAKRKSNQITCSNNMRQIGVGLQLYADDNQGMYPQTSHTAEQGKSWIYELEQYLTDFDEVRICPADPKAAERRSRSGTSYVLNSFVFVPSVDAFGELEGVARNRPASLAAPSSTILAFCSSDTMGSFAGDDHTHSDEWSNWNAVCRDIAPNMHFRDLSDNTKGNSNYLFADGHVENWQSIDVKKRIESGQNIAKVIGHNEN
jgi:prepilin-type N-terminal cleavage/methylation domain-containing protein/prepilin-type processing-associated H-X9-DG protein